MTLDETSRSRDLSTASVTVLVALLFIGAVDK